MKDEIYPKKKKKDVKKKKNSFIDTEPTDDSISSPSIQSEVYFTHSNLRNLWEKYVGIKERRRRSQSARSRKTILNVKRKIARAKMAGTPALKRRALAATKTILRNKFAGQQGASYNDVSMAAKIAIDKIVEKRASPAMIKSIVKKVMPGIRRKEARRLASQQAGNHSKSDEHHTHKLSGRQKGRR